MSRKRSRRGTAAKAAPRKGPPTWSRRAWIVAGLAVVAVLAAVVWILRPGARRPGSTAAVLPPEILAVPVEQIADSVLAATKRQDYERALMLANRLSAMFPGNPTTVMALGLAWHNYAWGGSRHTRERWAARTSLERVKKELFALDLLDSSATLARIPAERARALRWQGQTYENLGLPLDALHFYEEADRRHSEPENSGRLAAVTSRLRNPVP